MPATLNEKAAKYVANLAKKFSIDPDSGSIALDELGSDFIKRLIWKPAIQQEIIEFTLGELNGMLTHLNSKVQFEINETNVNNILFGKEGIAKSKEPSSLYQLVEVLAVDNDGETDMIIGGGRHRVTALVTLLQGVEDWQEFMVPCRLIRCDSYEEALDYVSHSNGSRSMTATEKTQLELGMSVIGHKPSEFFAEAREASRNFTQVKNLISFAMGAQLSDLRHLRSGQSIGVNTAIELSKKIISAVTRELNKLNGSSMNKFLVDPFENDSEEVSTYLQELATAATEYISDSWDDLFLLCRVDKRDGKTEWLLARALGDIAKVVSEEIVEQYGATLVDNYKLYVSQVEAKKAEASEAKKAKVASNKKASALATLSMLLEAGSTDETMLLNICKAASLTQADLDKANIGFSIV